MKFYSCGRVASLIVVKLTFMFLLGFKGSWGVAVMLGVKLIKSKGHNCTLRSLKMLCSDPVCWTNEQSAPWKDQWRCLTLLSVIYKCFLLDRPATSQRPHSPAVDARLCKVSSNLQE